MSNANSVLVVGDAIMDNQYYVEALPKAGQDVKIVDFSKSTGGSAANAAIVLSKCGVKTYFCCSVGADADGQTFIENFKKGDVDTSLVRQSGKTGFTVTMVDNSGERTMLSYRGASASTMKVTQALAGRIKKVSMVLLSGYMLTEKSQAAFVLEIAKEAKAGGTPVALDPTPVVGSVGKTVLKKVLALTDVLLPNESELNTITQMVGKVSVPCVAVKMGSRGAKMMFDIAEYSRPANEVDAVDTTGAGDAFNAAFIASMVSGDPPQTWLKKGVEFAAEVVARKGAL